MHKYHYIFQGFIDNENVNKLIEKLDPIDKEIILYISGEDGGQVDATNVLIDYLNQRADTISLKFFHILYSSGTRLLYEFNGKKDITELDVMIFHNFDLRTQNLRLNGAINDKIRLSYTIESNNKFLETLKNLGLRDIDFKKLKRGEDVVYYRKDFHRLKDKDGISIYPIR